MVYRISELNIYPIKSTAQVPLTEAHVEPRGLQWDRRWMVVDAEGVFVTARQHPRLTLVHTAIADGTLRIEAPGMPLLATPLDPGPRPHLSVRVWKDLCEVPVVSETADRWFSEYLGLPCRLVHMEAAYRRPVKPEFSQVGDTVSFADGFPLLLLSEASLDDLNGRLATPVSMRRFRPNLVVWGGSPFMEDAWHRIRVGELEFEVAKACSRCIFTTVDPDTAERDPHMQPLRTLGSYRRGRDSGVFFGQNLIPRTTGLLRLGDPIEVLS